MDEIRGSQGCRHSLEIMAWKISTKLLLLSFKGYWNSLHVRTLFILLPKCSCCITEHLLIQNHFMSVTFKVRNNLVSLFVSFLEQNLCVYVTCIVKTMTGVFFSFSFFLFIILSSCSCAVDV